MAFEYVHLSHLYHFIYIIKYLYHFRKHGQGQNIGQASIISTIRSSMVDQSSPVTGSGTGSGNWFEPVKIN